MAKALWARQWLGRLRQWARQQWYLLLVVGLYLVFCAALFSAYRAIINPDGISYISLAEKYARGDFYDAVNAYWSPLLSWLLAPFALVHLNMQAAAKLLSILAGALALVMVWGLCRLQAVDRRLERVMLPVVAFLLAVWALTGPITPDLLSISAVLGYVWLQLQAGRRPRWWLYALIGATAALGFYTKSFLLGFFVVHLLVWAVYCYKTDKTYHAQALRRSLAWTFGTLVVLLVPWLIVLSAKYHQPMLSSSGKYNYAINGPKYSGLHPMSYRGLLPPSNASALSVWEDPTAIVPEHWSPLASVDNFQYFKRMILGNIGAIGAIFLSFSVFSLAVLLWALKDQFEKRGREHSAEVFLLISAVLIYTLGYALLIREERYFWPVFIVLIVLAGVLATAQGYARRTRANLVVIGFFVLSLVYFPSNLVWHQRYRATWRRDEIIGAMPEVHRGSRLASDSFDGIYNAYYWKLPFYGVMSDRLDEKATAAQFRAQHIDTVVLYNVGADWKATSYLKGFHEVHRTGLFIVLQKS